MAWFADATLLADTEDGLTVEVMNELAARWIPIRYARLLDDVLTEVGRSGDLR